MIVYNTVNEMSHEADKAQGRDTLNYCRQAVCTIIYQTHNFSLTTLNSARISLGSSGY